MEALDVRCRKRFDDGTQWLIALYGLLISFPVLKIPHIDISVTFPIFLLIIYRVSRQVRKLFDVRLYIDKLLLAFVVVAWGSIFFSHELDIGNDDKLTRDFKSVFYLLYWLLVYLFFKKWTQKINLKRMSLFSLLGFLLSLLVIYLGDRSLGGFYSLGPFAISQNAFAFNTVACIGISSAYLLSRYGLKGTFVLGSVTLLAILVCQSRAGAVIVLVQILLFAGVALAGDHQRSRKLLSWGALIGVLAFAIGGFVVNPTRTGDKLATLVEPYSPGLATLIEDPERVQNRDKSWLVRRSQIEKGLKLFSENPLTGIGWGHFRYVRADIDVGRYTYLTRSYDSYALHRSSHNTYIQVLAETGIAGFILLVLITFNMVKRVLQNFIDTSSRLLPSVLGISVLGIACYFFLISAITGAVWYVMIGLFVGVDRAREPA